MTDTAPFPVRFFIMAILVNGKVIDEVEGLTVETLLRRLNVPPDFTAVSLNGEVLRKNAYATIQLRDNDKVEIVRPVGGG